MYEAMSSKTVKVLTVGTEHERRRFLQRSPLFGGLSDESLTMLTDLSKSSRVYDGARLFAKGDPPDAMYGVVRGCIRAVSSTPDGREALLALMEPGCWFGESSLFEGQPRAYEARAQGETELVVMPGAKLDALLSVKPELYRHFVPLLCQRIRLSTLLLEGNALLSLEGRLANRLLLLYWNVLQGGASEPRPTLHLSQEDLSQMLGSSRQSISKLLGEWEKSGWIRRHYGGITLVEPSALQHLSQRS